MTTPDTVDTADKYVVLKKEHFWELLGYLNDGQRPIRDVYEEAAGRVLNDAVVIRRQDLFAGPCLATYANMIGLVAKNHGDPVVGKELLRIADYFEDQARLAHEEGYKLPTI